MIGVYCFSLNNFYSQNHNQVYYVKSQFETTNIHLAYNWAVCACFSYLWWILVKAIDKTEPKWMWKRNHTPQNNMITHIGKHENWLNNAKHSQFPKGFYSFPCCSSQSLFLSCYFSLLLIFLFRSSPLFFHFAMPIAFSAASLFLFNPSISLASTP